MKKIGIIGGIGPESTIDYYKLIIGAFREKYPERENPEIIIYSADLFRAIQIMEAGDWRLLTDWLVEKVVALHAAGAEFAAIGSNTPHVVFDQVRARSPIPMLSIVEETRRVAHQRGFRKIGLLGTRFTMDADFYQKSFIEAGMTLFVPEKEDRELIHHRLFTEIELGIIRDSTRRELLTIIERMINQHSLDAIILGCTELPLILTQDEFGVPFLNTTAIHAASIVNACLA